MDEKIANAARWRRQAAAQAARWRRRAAARQEDSLRENNLMYGGLIGIGAVFVQPFLTSGAASLDLPAKICVTAFSVAIPLLAALILLNRHETQRRRVTSSVFVLVTQQAALGIGFVGVVAGFWHITTIAGIAVLVGAGVGVAVHGAGYARLEEEDAQVTRGGEQPPQP